MRPVTLSTSGVSVSLPAVMDYLVTPFNVGMGIAVTGTVTYTVQHTFDDPFAATFTPASATWFTNASFTSTTANQDGNYAFPVRAIRINQSAGTGSIIATLIQAGAH